METAAADPLSTHITTTAAIIVIVTTARNILIWAWLDGFGWRCFLTRLWTSFRLQIPLGGRRTDSCVLSFDPWVWVQHAINNWKKNPKHSNTPFFKIGTSPLIMSSYVFLSVCLATFCQPASWSLTTFLHSQVTVKVWLKCRDIFFS